MRFPWVTGSRTSTETDTAEQRVAAVRSHLRVLLHELEQTLDRIEDKRKRGIPGAR